MNRGDIERQYKLFLELPKDADAASKRKRGHDFERFLHSLLELEGLQPRTAFRPEGEQIDGSFFLDHRVFLIEAKWHNAPLPASSLYSFKGKIDGKLIGTLGIFISMSGYSKDAIDALTLGKALNIILFAQEDIEASITGNPSFVDMLRLKLRMAAEEGVIYFPIKSIEVHSEPLLKGKVSQEEIFVITDAPPSRGFPNIVVVCEGRSDERILARMTSQILKMNNAIANVRFVVANGKMALPRMATTLKSHIPSKNKFIIVADSDGDIFGTERMIRSKLSSPDYEIVIAHPTLEAAWLSFNITNVKPKPNLFEFDKIVDSINITELAFKEPSFKQFENIILEATK